AFNELVVFLLLFLLLSFRCLFGLFLVERSRGLGCVLLFLRLLVSSGTLARRRDREHMDTLVVLSVVQFLLGRRAILGGHSSGDMRLGGGDRLGEPGLFLSLLGVVQHFLGRGKMFLH